jgi:hypothetical protein
VISSGFGHNFKSVVLISKSVAEKAKKTVKLKNERKNKKISNKERRERHGKNKAQKK